MSLLNPPSLDKPKDATLADSDVTVAGLLLDRYLASFDVTTHWLPIAATSPLVNWQTGLGVGNTDSGDDCAEREGSSDTFCSSFVSAVTYWGSHGGHDLFAQGSLDFLRPFNGAGTDIALPSAASYPQNGCAWRDFLSNYQHDWLSGALEANQPLPYVSDSNHTWDYWSRDPSRGDPAAPQSNAAWVAVLDNNALRLQNDTIANASAGTDGLELGQQSMVVAQRLANLGHLVLASYQAPRAHTPGHIAVLRVSNNSLSDVLSDGPTAITAGAVNAMSTSLRAAFDAHSCDDGAHPAYCGTDGIGAWESMATGAPAILFFVHFI